MKRALAGLLIFFLICTAGMKEANAQTRVTGDLDDDGISAANDAARVLRAARGIETLDAATSALADATGNMEVGEADAVAILLYTSGRIGAFSDLGVLSSDSLLQERHLDRFSYKGIVLKNDGYTSHDVSVTITEQVREDYIYQIADIYVKNIESIKTAFGGGEYLAGKETTQQIAIDNGAILAINGDGYSSQKLGPMVRTGIWYRDTIDRDGDVCVLLKNGELMTFAAGKATLETLVEQDAYQTWTGGANLLDEDGQTLNAFNCPQSLLSHSARTVIGYYEPGHYCFVTIDGRQNPDSYGATMIETAELMSYLGCAAAYTLNGGNSSVMATQVKILNYNPDGGRAASDIIYISEPVATNDGR
jgi:exopolysaccharide biosynthesis protein